MEWLNLLILAGILVCIGVLLTVALVWLMARGVLRPKRMNDAKAVYVLKRLSPGDLSMAFEEDIFEVIDESNGRPIRLPAWWIPHPAGGEKTCIIVHGYGDAKVGGIAWAPMFRSLGFNVLAVDLRGHGEAGGDFTSAGFYERHDLSRIIDQLRIMRPTATRQVVLFGVSLGAAVVAGTAAIRDDIDAVILDSPFAHFVHAAAAHGALIGLPLVGFQRMTVRLAGWMIDADFDSVAPVNLIPKIPCPLMLIHSAEDPFVVGSDAQALAEAMDRRGESLSPTILWNVPGAFHVLGLETDPAGYEQKINDFIESCGIARQGCPMPS